MFEACGQKDSLVLLHFCYLYLEVSKVVFWNFLHSLMTDVTLLEMLLAFYIQNTSRELINQSSYELIFIQNLVKLCIPSDHDCMG